MFERVCEVEAGDFVDPRLEDAFDWVSIERELRRDEEERTWGNTAARRQCAAGPGPTPLA